MSVKMRKIIHNRFKEHYCNQVIDNKTCGGKIIQMFETDKSLESLAVGSDGLWVNKDINITTFCTKCGKRFEELDCGPL